MYFLKFLLFNYNGPHFPPLLSPALPTPTSYPQFSPPLALSMGPSYMFLDLTLPLLSPNIPYDLTYKSNLINKTNEQKRTRDMEIDKFFLFLIELTDNNLFKIITATMNSSMYTYVWVCLDMKRMMEGRS